MKTFDEYLQEENTQGDEGTDKLSATRKRQTPCEPAVTPELLADFQKEMDKQFQTPKSWYNKYSITQSH